MRSQRAPPVPGQLRLFRQEWHPAILVLDVYEATYHEYSKSAGARTETRVRYLMSGKIFCAPQDFIENYTNPAQEAT